VPSDRIDRSVRRALDRRLDFRAAQAHAPAGVACAASPARSRDWSEPPLPSRGGPPPAGIGRTLLRLIVWLWAGLRFYAATGADKLAGRDTVARRATRLRRIFESLGPTFIKIGQQLSVRADFLPLEYCQEFAKMLDAVPPFPVEQARRTVERAAGALIADVFAEFDPAPIGSGSLACVYKARLAGGGTVAVKVRRPGVAARLAADMRALGWLLQLAEVLSLLKSGYTRKLRAEFTRMLFEELDFLREARNTELFRAEAIRAKHPYIRAPRVHFALCADDVLVTDLVTGVFVKDILAALERNDCDELERFRAQGIDLGEVARRLVLSAHWELLESLLFHADPHPANICVQPGNILIFLDFGSCGRLTAKHRRMWQRFYSEFASNNVYDMVQTAIAILEPLPAVDTDSFSHELEGIFWDWVHAMDSDNSAWWEKASGMLWMKFTSAARRHQVPVGYEIVRIFRATLIYDAIVFRLCERLDMREQFRRYRRQAGRRAKRRVRRAFWGRVEDGLRYKDYLQIEDLVRTGHQAVGRFQHFLDTPLPDFARELGKVSYAVTLVLRLVGLGLVAYIAVTVIAGWYSASAGEPITFLSILSALADNKWLTVAFAGVALVIISKAIQKFKEPDLD
jgi:ubiquinone biosynthesis protein